MARILGWGGIGVAIDGPESLLNSVLAELPSFYAEMETAAFHAPLSVRDGVASVELDGDLSYSGPDTPETWRAVSSRIELALVDRLPGVAVIHAGVVGDDRGAVVIAGRSGTGKSTLVAAMVAQGATYMSDEFALVDAKGRVHPYPRAMTQRLASGTVRTTPASAANAADPPLPVRLVALLSYADAGWDVSQLTTGEATLRLIEQCVNVRRAPEAALGALSAVASHAHCLGGTRGDADEAAALLLADTR